MIIVKCRSCGAPITWALTESGKRMPIDVEPAADGNLMFLTSVLGVQTPQVMQARDALGGARYKSHFATCPNAHVHRKAKP